MVLEDEGNSFAVPLDGHHARCRFWNCRCGSTSGQRRRGATPQKATLGMAYLRKGITWIPDYTLKVLDDDNAELTLRGTLVNEAEDLIHTRRPPGGGRAALRPYRRTWRRWPWAR